MNLTGTHINYYRLCKRKLWLFANNIQMEQASDLTANKKIVEVAGKGLFKLPNRNFKEPFLIYRQFRLYR